MKAKDRNELCEELSGAVHNLKEALDKCLPVIAEDIKSMDSPKQLLSLILLKSPRYDAWLDEVREEFGYRPPEASKIFCEPDISNLSNLDEELQEFLNFLKNWVAYGNSIEKEFERRKQHLHDSIDDML